MRRAYLASPFFFSGDQRFKMRMHPILKTWRAHLGTGLCSPTGTPVRTVGDGVVEFAGVQNGFGNVVFVKHRNQHVTVCAHLSRIDVKNGQSVEQRPLKPWVPWAPRAEHRTAPAFLSSASAVSTGPTNHRPAKRAAAPVSAAARPAFSAWPLPCAPNCRQQT